ncbi:MAG TPA: histidine kinase, partial [Cytophagales bacterium]|nr:histidine kinase [Cytophagales bacterium]
GLSLRINDELRKFFLLSPESSPVGIYNVTRDVKLFGEEHIKQVKQVFEGKKVTLKNIEVDLSRVSGRKGMEHASGVKYLDSMFTPIYDHDGSMRAVIYLGIDTTDVVLKGKELERGHKEILEATKMVSEYKLIALRSAMNPHFLFNVLNSIQYFISKNDKGQALMHLSMFSKLVRKILESSMSNKISINEEVTMLKYYIDLENLRFDQKFEVIYDIDDSLLDDDVMIPSLIIQPYVENSIIHGLLNKKDGVGRLEVVIKDMDDYVLCIIQDNGIGREAAKKFRDMDHKSLGTKVTEERLKIINKFDDISLKVVDLYDKDRKPAGTRTELKIKIN